MDMSNRKKLMLPVFVGSFLYILFGAADNEAAAYYDVTVKPCHDDE